MVETHGGTSPRLQKTQVCKTHLGTRNVDYRMKRYVFRRTVDGIHIIHLGKTWEKRLGDGGDLSWG